MCSKKEMRSEGNKSGGATECKIGEPVVEPASVAAFTGDTSYHTDSGATYNQPFMGKSAATTISESKRAGPCPPDMKPANQIEINRAWTCRRHLAATHALRRSR